MKFALLPLVSLVPFFLPSVSTSAVPTNTEVSQSASPAYSRWTESNLTRRQSNPDCPYTPFTEFKNNCPKGTTLAIYIGSSYAFTLDSVHDNPRQSITTRFDFENHQTFYATINQGAAGGPAPSASANVNTFFFMVSWPFAC
ncbi:hypothetical protein BDV98DRAFT_572522 [Pterulicium gracile]|uniref:Uncharacterized protein n=1 Tax=Pterulicium gracile TaxID=1884261 RepID=A0A5C3QC76_9AGAR|nr:hypothetical protein BDV98DRAFT_572522 [Pterula gracilis]